MKKLFFLAAAVLTNMALNAADPTTYFTANPVQTLSSEVSYSAAGYYEATSEQVTVSGGKVFMCHNDGTSKRKYITKQVNFWAFTLDGSKGWFQVCLSQALQAGDTIMISALTNGSGSSNARGIWVTPKDVIVRPSTCKCEALGESTQKEYVTAKYVVEASDDICGKDTVNIWRATGNGTYFKDLAIVRPAPVTDPVTTVTISGPTEAYAEYPISLKATTDVMATEYKWEVNGVEQSGSTASTFVFTADAAGNYSIVCSAKNNNNSDWAVSSAHVVTATVKPVLDQVAVTEPTTWDWTKAASVNQIQFSESSKPKKNDTILLANVDNMINDANFNSQAMIFSGEFAVRDGKYCQGRMLQFKTTIAGYVTIEYSNTGNNGARYLHVNGTKYGSGTTSASTHVIEYDIPVTAGDVTIDAKDGSDAHQYLRFYKVQFTTEKTATAIDNTEASEKIMKTFENGQLVIIKNGIKYNATGAIVK